MEIPRSLQASLAKVVNDDGKITVSKEKNEYLQLVKEHYGEDAVNENGELVGVDSSTDEGKFINALGTEIVNVFDKNTKRGEIPATIQGTTLSFSDPEPETTTVKKEVKKEVKSEVKNTETVKSSFDIPTSLMPPDFPTAPVLLNWTGYSQKVNQAFEDAFGEVNNGGKVPILSNKNAQPILKEFNFESVKQLQETVGAKADGHFGPETYNRTKTYIATNLNKSVDLTSLNDIKNFLGVLGTDGEVKRMDTVVDERIELATQYQTDVEAYGTFRTGVEKILDNVNGNKNSVESLTDAKDQAKQLYASLSPSLQNNPDVKETYTLLIAEIDNAMVRLQNDLSKQFTDLSENVGVIVADASNSGLKTGDSQILKDAKPKVEGEINKYPDINDSKKVGELKDNALKDLSDVGGLIDQVNGLMAKDKWSDQDAQLAISLIKKLPDGEFKDNFLASIDNHDEKKQLLKKNAGNLPTAREGLHDTIGNGFFNLQNTEGTQGMLQLTAKQGLLGEALSGMNYDDQVRAIKVLTKGIKFKKGDFSESQQFNLTIARAIYDNMSGDGKTHGVNVDKDIKKKVLKEIQGLETPKNFNDFKIDSKTFAEGLKFSIGSDRTGNEKEAALTMARGIIHGEVSNDVLGNLSRYELDDLAKFVGKKGSESEKNALLGTVSQAFSEGVSVNIKSLDKSDKGKVLKGVLDIDGVNESKLTDLVKMAGNKAVYSTVRDEDLSNKQLAVLAKHTNGDKMANEPDVGAKLLVGMVKTYTDESEADEENTTLKIGDIRSFIKEVDKDWWEDDDTMEKTLDQLGAGADKDGPETYYARFRDLAPATLDKIRDVAR